MNHIDLSYTPSLQEIDIALPSSKSESNRALIINALCDNKADLSNLSEARDTQTMIRLLKSDEQELDVLDAGTTMRFLIGYTAVKNLDKILTGTERMCERPVKILIEALHSLGAEIDYLGKEGYPPVHIKGIKNQRTNHIFIKGDVSSQYISALLMIAPNLPEGLSLELVGKVYSRPYIEMTLQLMQQFGISYTWNDNIITISPQEYKPVQYKIESDWSGASYWYSLVALAKDARLTLLGLRENSLQGDIRIAAIMDQLGVRSTFSENRVLLTKKDHLKEVAIDFTDCPDLAQTVAVVCAVKGVVCKMTGLESLRIKETDRILALQNELGKIGASLIENNGEWTLIPSKENLKPVDQYTFSTYDDHRMAMAFAPLATNFKVRIEHPEVVNKSYPSFWNHLMSIGIKTSQI